MQDPSAYSQINPQFPEHQHLKCPRCDSINTKFCYYNNYNLSQPRHFCKNCRRYWTKGGTLRNIPIGGGTRKTTKRSSNPKRSSSSPSPSPSPAAPAASTSPTTASSLSVQSQPKPEPPGDRVLDVGGSSFSSLLASDGQFLSMESMQMGGFREDPNSDESGMVQNPLAEFPTANNTNNNVSDGCFSGGAGEISDYWSGGNGWPGLSIYTPPGSSDF